MTDLVTYADFPNMGLHISPAYIRVKVRRGTFPKPVKGAGIDGAPRVGVNSAFYWSRGEIKKYLKQKAPAKV